VPDGVSGKFLDPGIQETSPGKVSAGKQPKPSLARPDPSIKRQ
jgi:hypothetical protein